MESVALSRRRKSSTIKNGAYLFVVPVLFFFVVWNLVPFLWMAGLSFYRYVLVSGEAPRFLGFHNYAEILGSHALWNSLSRTFNFVVWGVLIETVLGCVIGYLFWGSKKMPGRRLALVILFAPMMISPVATGSFFLLIYNTTFGILNYFISHLTGNVVNFLGDARWATMALLAVDIWMWTPFMTLMVLAALGSVPTAEFEAAEVENLSLYRKVRHVILPHGKFILMLGILLRTIDSFKTTDIVYTMTDGGPGNITELLGLNLYRRAFNSMDMGQSSAMAIVSLLIAIAFTSIYLYTLKAKQRSAN